jgi:hypothetical protein
MKCNKDLKITAIPERDVIWLFKVKTLLTFELSQSESTEFNCDQSDCLINPLNTSDLSLTLERVK